MSVRPPAGSRARRAVTWVNRKRVRHTRRGKFVTFRLRARGGAAVDWAVTSGAARSRSSVAGTGRRPPGVPGWPVRAAGAPEPPPGPGRWRLGAAGAGR